MTNKSFTHKFVSAIADGTDATLVRPSNWNDDHNCWLGYRAVSGTSDTIANTDHLSIITYTNVAAIAVSLAAPGGGNFPLGWQVRIRNIGASLLTLTGTGGATINGNASVTVRGGDALDLHSTGTANYVGVPIYGPSTTLAINAPGGRLTLQSGTPIMLPTAGNGFTTIYYTPYVHQWVPIYDGTTMQMYDTGGELSQAVTDTTKSPAAVVSNTLYDMFVWNDAGTMRCTRGPGWSNSGVGTSARGTGAGTTELVRIKGVLLNANSITNGPAAQRGTYVGTIFAFGATDIRWNAPAFSGTFSIGQFYVWNYANRIKFSIMYGQSTLSWTYNSTTIESPNMGGGWSAYCDFIAGVVEDAVEMIYEARATSADGVSQPTIGIGLGLSVPANLVGSIMATAQTTSVPLTARYVGMPTLGRNAVSPAEKCSNTTANTFYGENANVFSCKSVMNFWA